MRIGIIDLGTNSVRFDIHQLGAGKTVRQLHREKIMVRLGQGIFVHGRLDRGAIRRTLHAFLRFKRIASQFHAQKILAFGTSALREAHDRDRFLSELQVKTGIHVRVISGAEEANLIALGILSQKKVGKGRFALVDIGGGSTEISICRGRQVLHSASFQLGTARLQQVFLKQNPPQPEKLLELRKYIRNTLYEITLTQRWPKVDRVIGSSGTIRALTRILKKSTGKDSIESTRLHGLVERMSGMNATELLGISGMESKRVDMILGGAVLLEECMEAVGAKKATSTELSLRDGILEEELRLFQQGNSSHLSLHIQDLYDKARNFGAEQTHLTRTVKLAEQLYQALQPVHKLKPQWKVYLSAATILRDTGEAINLARHAEHSYYILRNADLPAMDDWEIEFVARLCLLHEEPKLAIRHFAFLKNRARREIFKKLLAMLKVVDALDPGQETTVRIRQIKVGKSQVKILLGGSQLTGLESLNVVKVSAFFKETLGRAIVAEATRG